jgi:hypothetical protein
MLWRFAKIDDVRSVGPRADAQWAKIVTFINEHIDHVKLKHTEQSKNKTGLCTCIGCSLYSDSDDVVSDEADVRRQETLHDAVVDIADLHLLDASPVADVDLSCRISWINNLWMRRKKWARRYIILTGTRTRDLRSSQRVESTNKVWAGLTNKGTTLCKVLDALDTMDNTLQVTYNKNIISGNIYTRFKRRCEKAYVIKLKGVLTKWAYKKNDNEAHSSDR